MADHRPAGSAAPAVVVLDLPVRGAWTARNSPARRVPSHGTDLLASTWAIDLVAVDARGRSSARYDWRSVLATEPPDRFVGFGAPVLAPAGGRVVAVHDGEPDHPARRSLAALPYLATQRARLRAGLEAVAGNHVVLALADDGPYVALVHLREGSLRVAPGDEVAPGTELARCGSSGNATQPHVHLQVMDGPDPRRARGLPLAFRGYRARTRGGAWRRVDVGVPDDGETVEHLPT